MRYGRKRNWTVWFLLLPLLITSAVLAQPEISAPIIFPRPPTASPPSNFLKTHDGFFRAEDFALEDSLIVIRNFLFESKNQALIAVMFDTTASLKKAEVISFANEVTFLSIESYDYGRAPTRHAYFVIKYTGVQSPPINLRLITDKRDPQGRYVEITVSPGYLFRGGVFRFLVRGTQDGAFEIDYQAYNCNLTGYEFVKKNRDHLQTRIENELKPRIDSLKQEIISLRTDSLANSMNIAHLNSSLSRMRNARPWITAASVLGTSALSQLCFRRADDEYGNFLDAHIRQEVDANGIYNRYKNRRNWGVSIGFATAGVQLLSDYLFAPAIFCLIGKGVEGEQLVKDLEQSSTDSPQYKFVLSVLTPEHDNWESDEKYIELAKKLFVAFEKRGKEKTYKLIKNLPKEKFSKHEHLKDPWEKAKNKLEKKYYNKR